MRILNRIVTWTNEGIRYGADQRHVEIAMQQLGLRDDSRGAAVPCVKDEKHRRDEDDVELDRSGAKAYRCKLG